MPLLAYPIIVCLMFAAWVHGIYVGVKAEKKDKKLLWDKYIANAVQTHKLKRELGALHTRLNSVLKGKDA